MAAHVPCFVVHPEALKSVRVLTMSCRRFGAVMASDFAIAQFRFLERLLVVHGHWCYKRIAQMICYFFYKNIAFGLTLFYFEAFTGFSGQSVYDDWYMLLFNVVLVSIRQVVCIHLVLVESLQLQICKSTCSCHS